LEGNNLNYNWKFN